MSRFVLCWLLALSSVFAAIGCTSMATAVRTEYSSDFGCEREDVDVRVLGKGHLEASGCGPVARYRCGHGECLAEKPFAPQPASLSSSADASPTKKAAATELPRFPPLGAPTDPESRADKRYTKEEHPYAFFGNFADGRGECDATRGFTFANLASIGVSGDGFECERKYAVDGGGTPRVRWTAHCTTNMQAEDGTPARGLLTDTLAIDLKGKPATATVPVPRFAAMSIVGSALILEDGSESQTMCSYVGFVVQRITDYRDDPR